MIEPFRLNLGIYPFDIIFSFGNTNQEIAELLERYEIADSDIELAMMDDDMIGRTVMFETNQTIIRMKSLPLTPKEYGTLFHEIFHAVTFIMDTIGMKLKVRVSDEAYAYLIDFITTQCLSHIENAAKSPH